MPSTLIAAVIALAAAFGAGLAWGIARRRQRPLLVKLAATEAELKAQQASQAQIMHTTKLASLGQMVAGVAHEINTPLGFVKSNVEVVSDLLKEHESALIQWLTGVDLLIGADGGPGDRGREAMARLRRILSEGGLLGDARDLLGDSLDGIRSIAALVQNLKGFARVDRDGVDAADLNDCVRNALAVAGHQLRERITVKLELGELPKVRCMPSQINQVLLNLISNAAQAMEEGGTLGIVSRATASSVEVAISDTGVGIPAEVLPRIFDPFFTTKAVGEGTGLGLSIVHKIIKSHGGTIHVRTGPGQGTTFTFSVPLARREAPRELGQAA
jgi:signal transduction histidine kinase